MNLIGLPLLLFVLFILVGYCLLDELSSFISENSLQPFSEIFQCFLLEVHFNQELGLSVSLLS